MIKIQARIGARARTIEAYLVYSMQAPGLFVPGLRECEGQGLSTFPAGLRQHAAHTFVAPACSGASDGRLLQTWKSFPSAEPERTFTFVRPTSLLLSCFPALCNSVPEAGFTFKKTTGESKRSGREAAPCAKEYFRF